MAAETIANQSMQLQVNSGRATLLQGVWWVSVPFGQSVFSLETNLKIGLEFSNAEYWICKTRCSISEFKKSESINLIFILQGY